MKRLKLLFNNSILKSIMTLTLGTIGGQFITILAAPIMTRLYSPEDIGLYTIIITAVGMFGGIIAGRYDIAIVTEENEENLYSLIKLCISISLILSIILGAIYSLYYFLNGNQSVSFTVFFLTVVLLLFLYGLELIFTSYNNREQNYNLISKGSISQATAKEGFMLFFGTLNPSPGSLILSEIIGRLLKLYKQSLDIKKIRVDFENVNFKRMFFVAKKYSDQPKFSVPALFANSLSHSSINLFVNQLFGEAILGYYSISYRVLSIPLALISANISKVYFKEATKDFNKNGNYNNKFVKTTLLLMSLGMPMVIFLYLFSPTIFEVIFGSEWSVAGRYVQILAPMYGIRLIVSPLTIGMILSRKQKYEFLTQSLFLFASIIAFLVTKIFNLSVEIYLLLISLTYSLIYLLYYFILYKISKIENIKEI